MGTTTGWALPPEVCAILEEVWARLDRFKCLTICLSGTMMCVFLGMGELDTNPGLSASGSILEIFRLVKLSILLGRISLLVFTVLFRSILSHWLAGVGGSRRLRSKLTSLEL